MSTRKPHNVAFGRAMREFRLAKNLTQKELGDLSGVDRTFVSLLELGDRSPTLNTMVGICSGLGCSLIELMTRTFEILEAPPLLSE